MPFSILGSIFNWDLISPKIFFLYTVILVNRLLKTGFTKLRRKDLKILSALHNNMATLDVTFDFSLDTIKI